MREYVAADPAQRAGLPAARALRAHFRWPAAGGAPLRPTPPMVLGVIDRTLEHITRPICANCQDECPCSGRDPWACSPGAWHGTNCYEFCEPFFANPTSRPHVVLHEMMHSWERMGDVAYENEGPSGYPPDAGRAQVNADSYAALIRDLG